MSQAHARRRYPSAIRGDHTHCTAGGDLAESEKACAGQKAEKHLAEQGNLSAAWRCCCSQITVQSILAARTAVPHETLDGVFRHRCPGFQRVNDDQVLPAAA